MSDAEPYVPTAAIRDAVRGRETDVLKVLGIQWNDKSSHIVCPYPDHPDRDPSWRWDNKHKVAFCSCIGTRPGENKGHSIRWLERHREIEIVSRDRCGLYAQGARQWRGAAANAIPRASLSIP